MSNRGLPSAHVCRKWLTPQHIQRHTLIALSLWIASREVTTPTAPPSRSTRLMEAGGVSTDGDVDDDVLDLLGGLGFEIYTPTLG